MGLLLRGGYFSGHELVTLWNGGSVIWVKIYTLSTYDIRKVLDAPSFDDPTFGIASNGQRAVILHQEKPGKLTFGLYFYKNKFNKKNG